MLVAQEIEQPRTRWKEARIRPSAGAATAALSLHVLALLPAVKQAEQLSSTHQLTRHADAKVATQAMQSLKLGIFEADQSGRSHF